MLIQTKIYNDFRDYILVINVALLGMSLILYTEDM